jgi:cell division protein FtsB
MENTITNNVVLEKKMDCYNNNNLDNFTAPQELTVTITLHEYRKLVEEVATKKQDIDKANQDKYERDCENKKLKEEVAKLKEEIYNLRSESTPKVVDSFVRGGEFDE